MPALHKIEGVQIFSAGTWNGRKHDINALNSMVTAFNALAPGWTPSIKLGHDENQVVAKKSGLPACGWVDKIYLRGDKVYADFNYLPEKVYTAIKSKGYRKVSCEVYYNVELAGNKYSHVIGAVALLGNEMPGVTNLDDVMALYSSRAIDDEVAKLEKSGNLETESQTFELSYPEEPDMPAAEELQKQLDDATAKAKAEREEFEAKQEASNKELDELRKFKADQEAKEVERALELKKAKRETFMKDLEKSKLVTPATSKLVDALLEDKAEFSLNLGEKDEKYSREDGMKKLLELTAEAAKVNFDENSLADKEGDAQKNKGIEDKIKAYQDTHKCEYDKAYRAVMKEETET